jgi:hypothetical protein
VAPLGVEDTAQVVEHLQAAAQLLAELSDGLDGFGLAIGAHGAEQGGELHQRAGLEARRRLDQGRNEVLRHLADAHGDVQALAVMAAEHGAGEATEERELDVRGHFERGEELERPAVEEVAGVDRERRAHDAMQGLLAATVLRIVLDVVDDQGAGVQDLDDHGEALWHLARRAAGKLPGRLRESGPEALAALAERVAGGVEEGAFPGAFETFATWTIGLGLHPTEEVFAVERVQWVARRILFARCLAEELVPARVIGGQVHESSLRG